MRRIGFLALLICLAAGNALAQGYPNRTVKIICSFPPGGGTDFLARLVAQGLSERWKQPVIVDNRPGGNGAIGARAGATAEPDGYTLYVGSSDHFVMGPHLFQNLPFDPLKDFVPVVPIANQHTILVVHPSLPVNTVKEFVALAKSKPGAINYSSSGNGTVIHLAAELFQSMANVKLTHIPYKGSGPATTALLAGEVTVSFAGLTAIVPQIKAGKVRPLALSAPKRMASLPDVPTMGEEGYPDLLIYSWNGIFVPVGTPGDVINRISVEVNNILRTPEVTGKLGALGLEPVGGTPAQFDASFKADYARWGKIIKDVGIDKTPM